MLDLTGENGKKAVLQFAKDKGLVKEPSNNYLEALKGQLGDLKFQIAKFEQTLKESKAGSKRTIKEARVSP